MVLVLIGQYYARKQLSTARFIEGRRDRNSNIDGGCNQCFSAQVVMKTGTAYLDFFLSCILFSYLVVLTEKNKSSSFELHSNIFALSTMESLFLSKGSYH